MQLSSIESFIAFFSLYYIMLYIDMSFAQTTLDYCLGAKTLKDVIRIYVCGFLQVGR